MTAQADRTNVLLASIRDGKPMTLRQQLQLTVQLSVPAVIAQLSSIVMQYIDAAMVGRLGAEASASIGLVSTTTWLFWGLCVELCFRGMIFVVRLKRERWMKKV